MLVEIKILSIVRQTLHGDHLDLQIPNKVNVLSLVRERVEAGSDLPDTHEQAWTSNVWSCGPAQYFSFIFRYPLSLCHIIIIILSKYRSLQQVSAQLRKALQVNIIKKISVTVTNLLVDFVLRNSVRLYFHGKLLLVFPSNVLQTQRRPNN